MKFYFNGEDASQIAIGAFAMALPVSFSEEVWLLGESLPLTNLLLITLLSLFFLVYFAYFSIFQANVKNRIPMFIFRIIIAYLITLMVVALVLTSLNQFPITTLPDIAIKRMIIVTMPASLGAIIVDSLDKE
ncbi:DUF2391 family protein [Colwellia sp. M166]|uniref:DUF2391 family protein n=1 Tax=Colwellia sp. M166 TaxID=2583805 RepID=UPI00211EBC16|nr:DUF2391 family protein [Colwellia sp. M166]UUO22095.1 DUF2391 family protein [Colwellia sp. M166]|tara:strand:- start:6941 stop:7336 length:396 start_codon:yes stop_codon:yes gene_type:complete